MIEAVVRFTRRSAVRNNLYLFAWLCATVVPVGLQLLTGAQEDVADYLGEYYGPFSLFMFFTLSYGFATVFVAYYVVAGLRQAGTLDLLRVSGIAPRGIVLGVFWQLQHVLIPPVLAFILGFGAYAWFIDESRSLFSFGTGVVFGGALMFVLNQALLSALLCNALFRSEHLLALIAGLFVLPLNVAPVVVIYRMGMPAWLHLLAEIAVILALLWLAEWRLRRIWTATEVPLKGV